VIRKTSLLLATVSLALFAFAAHRIGWDAVVRAIEQAKTGVVIILGLSLVRLILQTCSWSIALQAEGIRSTTRELMFIRLASQGVGYLSVLGPLASEPLKINLLRDRSDSVTAATLVDTCVYWFTSGILGIAGCFSAALLLSNSQHSVVPSLILGAMLAGGLLLIARPKSRLSALVDALGVRCPGWLAKAKQVEDALRRFERQYPESIRRMFLFDAACQLLLAAEVVAMLWCLKIPFHAGIVLGIEGATRAIKVMAGWMPARIGADESGVAGAFFAFGLSPASGLTLALARRSRDLLAALVGVIWLVWSAGSSRPSSDQISEASFSEEKIPCELC
jgi:hypothetical protein